ncbi:MAG: hypothetical protein EB104_04075 [Acidimicrobiia bacterium]|nr:hypothetical protein [Acidimicrobiia bacterium]
MLKSSELVLPFETIPERRGAYRMFVIDDFLGRDYYRQLVSTFPDEYLQERLGHRLAVNVDLEEVLSALKKKEPQEVSELWESFLKAWKCDSVLTNLLRIFRYDMRDRYVPWWRLFLAWRIMSPKRLRITILLSVYRKGFRLTPHSDDKFKLLSLILYFPSADSKASGEGGTLFFQPRPDISRRKLRVLGEWSRGLRRHLPLWLAPSLESSLDRKYTISDQLNPKQEKKFDSLFMKSQYVSYQDNRLSGFVKNDWSMHEVNLEDFPEGELRRAVLINVRLQPTPLYGVIQPLEQFLARAKKLFQG